MFLVTSNDRSERVPFGGFFAVQIGSPSRDDHGRRLDAGVMSKAYESEEPLRRERIFFARRISHARNRVAIWVKKTCTLFIQPP